MRIGIHTSRAGALENAAIKAGELGANCFQIFSSSPRMWRASVPDPADVGRFRDLRQKHDLFPLAIHTNYLVNLATLDPVIRAKSIASFRGELDRAVTIGAEYLVIHPGNYKGNSVEQGMAAFVLGLAEAAIGLRAPNLMVLLENTVGGGCQIGSRFEELRTIRDLAARETELPIGYCLDTCHLYAAGFDISSEPGLEATLQSIDKILGLADVRVFHANDSRGQLGSKLDRHQNIGQGCIGNAGFRRLLRDPRLRDKAFILETPVDEEGDDQKNVDALKRLAGVARKRRANVTLG